MDCRFADAGASIVAALHRTVLSKEDRVVAEGKMDLQSRNCVKGSSCDSVVASACIQKDPVLEDVGNGQRDFDSILDRLQVLFRQEATFYKTTDYLVEVCATMDEEEQALSCENETLTSESQSPLVRRENDTSFDQETKGDAEEAVHSLDSSAVSRPKTDDDSVGVEQDPEQPPMEVWVIDEQYRSSMAEWGMQVTDSCGYPRNVVAVCMNMFDRYVALRVANPDDRSFVSSKADIQLLMLASMLIACKLGAVEQPRNTDVSTSDGPSRPFGILTIDHMCHMSGGRFSREQISQMERDILKTLDWHVHPPTAETFFQHYMLLLFSKYSNTNEVAWRSSSVRDLLNYRFQEITDASLYILDNAVLDYFFVGYSPSVVAMTVFFHVMTLMHRADSHLPNEVTQDTLRLPSVHMLEDLCHAARLDTMLDSRALKKCRDRLAQLIPCNEQVEDSSSKVSSPARTVSNEDRNPHDKKRCKRMPSPVSVIKETVKTASVVTKTCVQ